MSHLIELNNIDVDFISKKKKIRAINNVTLHVDRGDVYGIVGYSGAGKSTLARTINLLQKPTHGKIKVGNDILFDGHQKISDKKLQEKRQKIGIVFQHFNLLNEMTVEENILFALRHNPMTDLEAEKKVYSLLTLVNLDDKAKFYPNQLSGGEKQRVSIARALANDPDILISDEATSALDPKNTMQILELLERLNNIYNLTIILITHEMDVVKRIANKLAIMQNGKIVEQGNINDVYFHPKKEITHQFVGGSINAFQTLKSFNLDKLAPNEQIFQVIFQANNLTNSIILDIYKKFNLDVSMLYGNIEVLNGRPVGTMLISVKGETNKIKLVKPFLENKNVEVELLNYEEILND